MAHTVGSVYKRFYLKFGLFAQVYIREFKRKQQRDEISQYMSSSDDDGDGAYTLGDLLNTKKND